MRGNRLLIKINVENLHISFINLFAITCIDDDFRFFIKLAEPAQSILLNIGVESTLEFGLAKSSQPSKSLLWLLNVNLDLPPLLMEHCQGALIILLYY